MAVSRTDDMQSVDEPVLRQIQPKPFRWDALDPAKIVISYDRSSDTLLIHLFGRGRPSISVPIERYLYAMVDPESEKIIGVHIEGFLAQAVPEHPGEIEILDHAELRGITPVEVRALQREVLGTWHPLPGRTRAVLAPDTPADKTRAVSLLLSAENARWGLPDTSAA